MFLADSRNDQTLLELISNLLCNTHDDDEEKLNKLSCSSVDDGEKPSSSLERSLCYILVDKALLNCLLILDKAIMEDKLSDRGKIQAHKTLPGEKLVAEFARAINENRQFLEKLNELKRNELLVDRMRTQIRQLSSEKSMLENENKGLKEKIRLWKRKSEDEKSRNSIIESERQRLKEKVLFLEESMKGLQSSTEHLRRQLQAQDKLKHDNNFVNDELDSGEMSSFVESNPDLSGDKLTSKMNALMKENQLLKYKIEEIETDDYESKERLTDLADHHAKTLQKKDDEIQMLLEKNQRITEDLETSLTDVLLLKSKNFQLQQLGCSATDKKELLDRALEDSGLRVLADKETEKIQELTHRVEETEASLQANKAFLQELSKRKTILVDKLEMAGAVVVIKNDFDVPDGYTVAVDALIRSQSSLIEKG